MTLRYRLTFEHDDNGTLLVTSPDLPIVTYGETEAEASVHAADAIKVVIESLMKARQDVPWPDVAFERGARVYDASLQTEMKVRLHQAMRAAGATRADLARKLGWNRESVDRLFRLDHNSRLDQLDQAFKALGRVVAIDVRDAA